MKTFKFITAEDTPIHVPITTRLVLKWMKRRSYPIRMLSVTSREVVVELDAPSNAEHNRAVNSLGRIVQRRLDRHHNVVSKLSPSYSFLQSFTSMRLDRHRLAPLATTSIVL